MVSSETALRTLCLWLLLLNDGARATNGDGDSGGDDGSYGITEGRKDFKKEIVEREKTSMLNLVKSSGSLLTWYSLQYGQLRDLVKMPVAQDDAGLAGEDVAQLRERIMCRLYDVQCTYAYYARKHLSLVYSVIEEFLLFPRIFGYLTKIKAAYMLTAFKAAASLKNQGYRPTGWMLRLISFLSQHQQSGKQMRARLAELLDTLTAITSSQPCVPYRVPSPPPVDSADIKDAAVHALSDDMKKCFPYRDMDDWSKKNDVRRCPNIFRYACGPEDGGGEGAGGDGGGESLGIKICDAYIFDRLKTITADVNHNILDAQRLLHANRSILPTDEYELYEHPGPVIENLSPYNDENRYAVSEDDDEQLAELTRATELLHVRVYALLDTIGHVWSSNETKDGIKLLKFTLVAGKKRYSANDHNAVSEKLTVLENRLMEDLQCLYAQYAHTHLIEADRMLTAQEPNDVGRRRRDAELVSKYFELSLMTLATIFNKGFQPLDWMVKMIVYLQNVKRLEAAADKKALWRENNIMQLIVRDQVAICNPGEAKPKEFNTRAAVLKEITEGGEQLRRENGVNYYIRLMNEWESIADDGRKEYAQKTYANLVQATYFLELCSDVLPFAGHKRFHPAKWMWTGRDFGLRDVIERLRWDAMTRRERRPRRSRSRSRVDWDEHAAYVRGLLLLRDDADGGSGLNFATRVHDATILHHHVLELVRAALVRFYVSYCRYCADALRAIDAIDPDHLDTCHPTAHAEFEALCVGRAQRALRDVVEWSDMDDEKMIFMLVDELTVDNLRSGAFETKASRRKIRTLSAVAVNSRVRLDLKVRPVWTSTAALVHTWPVGAPDVVGRVFYWLRDLNDTAAAYAAYLRQRFPEKNFNTFKLMIASVDNQTMRRRGE